MLLLLLYFHLSVAKLTYTVANKTTPVTLSEGNNNETTVVVKIPAGYLESLDGFEHQGNHGDHRLIWRVNVSITSNFTLTHNEGIVTIILRHSNGAKSYAFKLPQTRTKDFEKSRAFGTFQRVVDLCPSDVYPIDNSSELLVTFLSNTPDELTLELNATVKVEGVGWQNRTDGNFGKEREDMLYMASPVLHTVFNLPNDKTPIPGISGHYVQLRVESLPGSDCFCTLVSVQQPKCPYFDTIGTASRFSEWQTMESTTTMVINTNKYSGSMLIALVAAESDELCNFSAEKNCTLENSESDEKNNNNTIRTRGEWKKRVKISWEPIAEDSTRLNAIFLVAAAYVIILAGSLVVAHYQFQYNSTLFEKFITEGGLIAAAIATNVNTTAQQQMEIVDDDDDIKNEADQTMKKNARRLIDRTYKFNDPSMSKSLYQKNSLFMGGFLIVSIFYAVTVFQTAFNAQAEQKTTQNNDICYFNSRCQMPLTDSFLDFNHFFSNLGYIIFGSTFIGIVYLKTKKHDAGEAELVERHGVPYLCGIYYTMGGSIAMEGLMSAAYHICPTRISFQFDTTYMYLIAILIIIKLYQNRHPDTSASSVKAYLALGVAIALEAISLYYNNSKTFWAVFCIIYMLILLIVVANLYQLNTKVNEDKNVFLRVTESLARASRSTAQKVLQKELPGVRPLMVFLTVACIVNIGMCIYFGVSAIDKAPTASNYILYMFIANMFLYLNFYIMMKWKHQERLCSVAKIYFGK